MKIPSSIGFTRTRVHSQFKLWEGASPSSSTRAQKLEHKKMRPSTRLSKIIYMTGNMNKRSLEGRIQNHPHPSSSTERLSWKSRERSLDIKPQTQAKVQTSTSDDPNTGQIYVNEDKYNGRDVQCKASWKGEWKENIIAFHMKRKTQTRAVDEFQFLKKWYTFRIARKKIMLIVISKLMKFNDEGQYYHTTDDNKKDSEYD